MRWLDRWTWHIIAALLWVGCLVTVLNQFAHMEGLQ